MVTCSKGVGVVVKVRKTFSLSQLNILRFFGMVESGQKTWGQSIFSSLCPSPPSQSENELLQSGGTRSRVKVNYVQKEETHLFGTI